jgi:hypothetical protein
MEMSRSAESHATTENSGSCDAQFSRSKYDFFVEWPALVFIGLA